MKRPPPATAPPAPRQIFNALASLQVAEDGLRVVIHQPPEPGGLPRRLYLDRDPDSGELHQTVKQPGVVAVVKVLRLPGPRGGRGRIWQVYAAAVGAELADGRPYVSGPPTTWRAAVTAAANITVALQAGATFATAWSNR